MDEVTNSKFQISNIKLLKICFLFFVFCFSHFQLFAQKTEWSQPIELDSKYDYWKIVGQDETGFFLLESNISLEVKQNSIGFRSRKYGVVYFDNQMRMKWEKPIVFNENKSEIEKVLFVGDKILILHSVLNKEVKRISYFAQWLDGTGNFQKVSTPVFEINYIKKREIGEIEIAVSHDQSKIACVYEYADEESNESKQTKILAAIIDNDSLGIVWKKEIMLPCSSPDYEREKYSVSDDATLYIFGKKLYHDKHPNYILFAYHNTTDILSEYLLKTEGIIVTGNDIEIDNLNKKVIIAGFYSNKTDYSAAGIFYVLLEENRGTPNTSDSSFTTEPLIPSPLTIEAQIHPWDKNFLNKFVRESRIGNEIMNYHIDRLILRNDGGVVVVAESRSTSQYTYYDFFTKTYVTQTIYHCNNISVLSINPTAAIDWAAVIQKNQESSEDGGYYLSYCSLVHSDKMYYLYNRIEGKQNAVLLTSVNNKGEEKTDMMFNDEDDVWCISKAAKQTDENELIVPALRKRKLCFLKLTF